MTNHSQGRQTPVGNRTLRQAVRLACCTGAALAATAPLSVALAQQDPGVLEEIVVTGYRGSLLNSTNAKRQSVGVVDEIFSDDIGKLPSQNLAEALNRIPGVKIGRDVTGEGQQISVRGLGPSFTKTVLNGTNLWSSSDGSLNSTNRDRQVDLDFLPGELFRSLSVAKTPMAHQMEGGTSGYVDMRTIRAFDDPGFHIKGSLEGAYTSIDDEISPQGSFIISNTFNDNLGVLFGVVVKRREYRVDGYETIGYSDSCIDEYTGDPDPLTNSGCAAGIGPNGGGWYGRNHFQISPFATADYVAAHPELGLAVGDPIDPVATAGIPLEALDRGILPYLGRGHFTWGSRDLTSVLGSIEFRASDDIEMAVDVMYSEYNKDFERITANNWGRRNWLHLDAAWIPENLTYDAENQIITSGRLYNTHLWVEQRPYVEDFDFLSVMPSLSWNISDDFRAIFTGSYSDSSFYRSETTMNFLSPATPVDFDTLGDVGTFDYMVDVSQPNIGWVWNDVQNDQFRFRRNFRDTETVGLHADFELGEDASSNGFKFGAAFDKAERTMTTYSYQNEAELKENFLFPSAAYSDIESYMLPAPFTYGQSFHDPIGHPRVAVLDSGRLLDDINFDQFEPSIKATSDQFGAGVGDIIEEYFALYIEGNVEADILGRPLRMNAGVRWVDTDQTLRSLDRSATDTVETNTSYSKFLPSFSMTYDATDSLKLRASASNTMTRANPGQMYPNAGFTTSGIESAAAGNPGLLPFESLNFDLGVEYYFGELGYVGGYYFEKEVKGFTRNDTVDVLFADLGQFGLSPNPADLTPTQQAALDACGGPNSCTVAVSTQVNIQTPATLKGIEAIWVQPLDFLLQGLGFNFSATHIEQDAADEAAIITGIADWTYNFTGFYENEMMSLRVTYYQQDGSVESGFQGGWDGSGGAPARRIKSDDRSQVDFAFAFYPSWFEDYNLAITLDGYNITDEPVRSLFEYDNLTNDIYYPGATYTLGVRASF